MYESLGGFARLDFFGTLAILLTAVGQCSHAAFYFCNVQIPTLVDILASAEEAGIGGGLYPVFLFSIAFVSRSLESSPVGS